MHVFGLLFKLYKKYIKKDIQILTRIYDVYLFVYLVYNKDNLQ